VAFKARLGTIFLRWFDAGEHRLVQASSIFEVDSGEAFRLMGIQPEQGGAVANRMLRLSSGSLKHRLWRAAISATPLPVFARPRDSSFWQKHWRETISDAEFPGYAISTDLKKWFARHIVDLSPASVLELGCNVGANLREINALDSSIKLHICGCL
jgi:hypothetical protein